MDIQFSDKHRSGFVNIIGHPNVGKSTLLNAIIGEKMSIITHKPQTTRHRIIAILNEDDLQIVFSDTPGMIQKPNYKLQEKMNSFVKGTTEDADLMLLVVDLKEVLQNDSVLVDIIKKTKSPLFLVLNKVDISNSELIQEKTNFWKKHASFEEIFQISALHKTGTTELLEKIKEKMPLGPAYYPKDQFTDRSERFFVSEIIREKILLLYHQEIPYASEVVVETFKDDPDPARKLVRILAHIFVSRKTQKGILIGDKGSSIKKLGIESRIDIEKFLEKKVHLELYVKVKEDWRDDDKLLKSFGYEE